ncbi:MAG TPA: hypothetical protein DEB13_02735 [Candidatus Yanofskybacteria bacterium]|nr:hypothetical protein [Candidatus Yanofskybacteria bacterium]
MVVGEKGFVDFSLSRKDYATLKRISHPIMPKVSVIIPTHNRPAMLKRAVNSVLVQTYQDFEIIIVDDGVHERARDVAKSFSDNRIRYIPHEQECGAPAARNTGIKNSAGEFIAFLDDDDEWLPLKLELQVRALTENPEAGLCFCGFEAVGENDKRLYLNKYSREGLIEPYLDVLNKSFAWTSSILARKNVLDRGFLFDEKLLKNQEWDLTLRMAKAKVKFYSINQVLLKLHVHGNQLGGPSNLPNRILGLHVFIQKHDIDYRKHPRQLSRRYSELALLYKDNKQRIKSLEYFAKAFFTYPRVEYVRGFISMLGGVFLKRILKKMYLKTILARYVERNKVIASLQRIINSLYGDTKTMRDMVNIVQTKDFMKKKFSFGHAGDFEVMMLYVLIRLMRPEVIIETGVASGRSSWAPLQALNENKKGKLYSIDFPQYFKGDSPEMFVADTGRPEFKGFVPEGEMPGWLVPQELRSRWELILGKSREKLPELLSKLGSVNIFYHDSDHSYQNMTFEYVAVWPHVSRGGFLLSDDIKHNNAFMDFINKNEIRDYHTSFGFGLMRKT